MKKVFLLFASLLFLQACGGIRNTYEMEHGFSLKDNEQILNSDDFLFLEELTKNVPSKKIRTAEEGTDLFEKIILDIFPHPYYA